MQRFGEELGVWQSRLEGLVPTEATALGVDRLHAMAWAVGLRRHGVGPRDVDQAVWRALCAGRLHPRKALEPGGIDQLMRYFSAASLPR